MWRLSRSRRLWLTSKGAPVDTVLAVLPWAYWIGIYLWGRYFGPNALPSWPIGNPKLDQWCATHVAIGLGVSVVIFAGVRFALHRRNLMLLIAALLSSVSATLATTSMLFA